MVVDLLVFEEIRVCVAASMLLSRYYTMKHQVDSVDGEYSFAPYSIGRC